MTVTTTTATEPIKKDNNKAPQKHPSPRNNTTTTTTSTTGTTIVVEDYAKSRSLLKSTAVTTTTTATTTNNNPFNKEPSTTTTTTTTAPTPTTTTTITIPTITTTTTSDGGDEKIAPWVIEFQNKKMLKRCNSMTNKRTTGPASTVSAYTTLTPRGTQSITTTTTTISSSSSPPADSTCQEQQQKERSIQVSIPQQHNQNNNCRRHVTNEKQSSSNLMIHSEVMIQKSMIPLQGIIRASLIRLNNNNNNNSNNNNSNKNNKPCFQYYEPSQQELERNQRREDQKLHAEVENIKYMWRQERQMLLSIVSELGCDVTELSHSLVNIDRINRRNSMNLHRTIKPTVEAEKFNDIPIEYFNDLYVGLELGNGSRSSPTGTQCTLCRRSSTTALDSSVVDAVVEENDDLFIELFNPLYEEIVWSNPSSSVQTLNQQQQNQDTHTAHSRRSKLSLNLSNRFSVIANLTKSTSALHIGQETPNMTSDKPLSPPSSHTGPLNLSGLTLSSSSSSLSSSVSSNDAPSMTAEDYDLLGYCADTSPHTSRRLSFKENHSIKTGLTKLFKGQNENGALSLALSSSPPSSSLITSPSKTMNSPRGSNGGISSPRGNVVSPRSMTSPRVAAPIQTVAAPIPSSSTLAVMIGGRHDEARLSLIQSMSSQSTSTSSAYDDYRRLRKSKASTKRGHDETIFTQAVRRFSETESLFNILPHDLVFWICEFFDFHDILRVSLVNWFLHDICTSDIRWKHFCVQKGLRLTNVLSDYRRFYIYHQIRVMIVGDDEVGKTSLVQALTNNPLYMIESYVSHQVTAWPYHYHTCTEDSQDYFMYFWDNNTCRQDCTESVLKSVDVVILCYATDDQYSLRVAKKWVRHLKSVKSHSADTKSIILAGLKTDARENDIATYEKPEIVTTANGQKLAKASHIASFKEVSCFQKKGLTELVNEVVRLKRVMFDQRLGRKEYSPASPPPT